MSNTDAHKISQINDCRIIELQRNRHDNGSLTAVEKLVEAAGGLIAGRMAILAEGDAQERDDIIYLEKLPLFHPDGTVIE